MKKTSELIRSMLKNVGINSRDVSVVCKSNYTIHIKNKTNKISHDFLVEIVKSAYYSKKHSWLCVTVDGFWLPMQNN